MPHVVADARSVTRTRQGDSHPLTFSQAFLAAVGDDGSGCADGHVIGVTVQVDERMELDQLQKALNRVVHRHSSLRSHIQRTNLGARMSIDPPAPVELFAEDAPDRDEEAQSRALEMQEIMEAQGISLDTSPLMRASVLRGTATSWLTVVLHHVAGDAHALAVVLRDVLAAYDDDLSDEAGESYADFALKQAEVASSDGWRGDVRWWQGRLAGATLATASRRERGVVAMGAPRDYVARVFHLDPSLTERLMNVCLERGTTPFSVLLSAFVHTVRTHMTREATSFMTISSGRDGPSRDTVGTFFNHVPVPVPLPPKTSSEPLDVVDSVHQAWEAARAHEAPFQLLVAAGVEGIDFSMDPDRVPVTFEWIPPAPHWHGSRAGRQIPSVPGEGPSAALPTGALWLMRLNDLDTFEGVIRYCPKDVDPQDVVAWIDEFQLFLDHACPA